MTDALTRRSFLLRCSAAGLALPLAAVLGAASAGAAESPLRGVTVRPRSDWAQGLPAAGLLASEEPGDVRVLVVHHSESPNGYGPDDVPGLLRGFHAFHTGPERGWPDVAYNFFVDRYGTVWEGRTGSLDGPVQPDATGGNQGFSQTCCFVGSHSTEPPTPEARRSMTLLLAALAERYGIEPAGTTTFVSRGSSRWPAGASVTTATIAGHRDMSLTTCPGDAAYAFVTKFAAEIAALPAARPKPSPAPPSTAPSISSSEPSSSAAASSSAHTGSSPRRTRDTAVAAAGQDDDIAPATFALAGGTVALGAAFAARRRRDRLRKPDARPASEEN